MLLLSLGSWAGFVRMAAFLWPCPYGRVHMAVSIWDGLVRFSRFIPARSYPREAASPRRLCNPVVPGPRFSALKSKSCSEHVPRFEVGRRLTPAAGFGARPLTGPSFHGIGSGIGAFRVSSDQDPLASLSFSEYPGMAWLGLNDRPRTALVSGMLVSGGLSDSSCSSPAASLWVPRR